MSVAALRKGQLEILAHTWDRDLGGRSLDNVLFHHFAEEFKAKTGLDVRENSRGSFRLRVGCEKVSRAHVACALS